MRCQSKLFSFSLVSLMLLAGAARVDVPWGRSIRLYDIKKFFNTGKEMTWDYTGRRIKCCVSSSGYTTKLQDMNAETLPSEGSWSSWHSTSCGYMFGATYHNCCKPGSQSHCSASIAKVMDAIGEPKPVVHELLGIPLPDRCPDAFKEVIGDWWYEGGKAHYKVVCRHGEYIMSQMLEGGMEAEAVLVPTGKWLMGSAEVGHPIRLRPQQDGTMFSQLRVESAWRYPTVAFSELAEAQAAVAKANPMTNQCPDAFKEVVGDWWYNGGRKHYKIVCVNGQYVFTQMLESGVEAEAVLAPHGKWLQGSAELGLNSYQNIRLRPLGGGSLFSQLHTEDGWVKPTVAFSKALVFAEKAKHINSDNLSSIIDSVFPSSDEADAGVQIKNGRTDPEGDGGIGSQDQAIVHPMLQDSQESQEDQDFRDSRYFQDLQSSQQSQDSHMLNVVVGEKPRLYEPPADVISGQPRPSAPPAYDVIPSAVRRTYGI